LIEPSEGGDPAALALARELPQHLIAVANKLGKCLMDDF
jgi:hypothetical protein